MPERPLLMLMFVALLGLAACGQTTTLTSPTAPVSGPAVTAQATAAPAAQAPSPAGQPTAAPAFAAEAVEQIAALSQMRGHLVVSLPLWEAGQYDLAETHAGHPIEELFALVDDELKAKNADLPLKRALDDYAALAGKAGDAAQVKAAHQAALAAAGAAEQVLSGTLLADPAFRGAVIRKLLEGVEAEYGEAVLEGKIAEAIEYQDALGFLTIAKEHYAAIAEQVKAGHPKEHEEIEASFSRLAAAFPDAVKLPAAATDPKDVEEQVREIVAELGPAVGLHEEAAQGPAAVVAEIRAKMAHALEEYKTGKADPAYEQAASAYLDGFEQLEADLLPKDKELVETLEVQFKELRDGIKSGKSIADLEALAKEINANLDKVEALLR